VRNAARAEVYGVDLDAEVLVTPRLRFTGSMEYLVGKYTSFPGAGIAMPLPGGGNLVTVGDASGNRMARAPRVTANAAVDYSMPLGSNLSADFNVTYSYTSKFFWEPDNYLFEDPYSLVNAKLTFNFSDRHKISIWGRNLTDKFYSVVSGAAAPGSVNSPGEPRTYGVAFETKF
jgi:iron complex outermembrane receptor protein